MRTTDKRIKFSDTLYKGVQVGVIFLYSKDDILTQEQTYVSRKNRQSIVAKWRGIYGKKFSECFIHIRPFYKERTSRRSSEPKEFSPGYKGYGMCRACTKSYFNEFDVRWCSFYDRKCQGAGTNCPGIMELKEILDPY